MKNAKSMLIALLAAALLIAGSSPSQAQSAQQPTNQTKPDSSTTKNTEKKNANVAPAQRKTVPRYPPLQQHQPPLPLHQKMRRVAARLLPTHPWQGKRLRRFPHLEWSLVNTESGVQRKPGTRWYGKTKPGKYMTESNAIQAGSHPAQK